MENLAAISLDMGRDFPPNRGRNAIEAVEMP
jgi:hypothetical protein